MSDMLGKLQSGNTSFLSSAKKSTSSKFGSYFNSFSTNIYQNTTENTDDKKRPGSIHIKKRNGKFELLDVAKIQNRLESLVNSVEESVLVSSDQVFDLSSSQSTHTSLSSSSEFYDTKQNKDATFTESQGPKLNVNVSGVVKKVISEIKDGMSTEELDTIALNYVKSKIQEEPDWDTFAGRLHKSNQYKKLRNFSFTERYKMMYHGTWPYMFEEFDVKKEMGLTFSFQSEDEHKKQALGDQKRKEAIDKLSDWSMKLDLMFSSGDSMDCLYNKKEDGPYLDTGVIKHNSGQNGPVFPSEDWTFLKSTNHKYMDSSDFQTLFLSKKRNDFVSKFIIDRNEIIQSVGGNLKYDKILKNTPFQYDSNGRIVRLHKIIDYDLYNFVCKQQNALEELSSSVRTNLHKTMTRGNSAYQAILGQFGYCLKTPITKRYLELPHESMIRCACQAVLSRYYEDCRYARCISKPDEVYNAELGYTIDDIITKEKNKPPEDRNMDVIDKMISNYKNDAYINFDLFDDNEWERCMNLISIYTVLLIQDYIALPTPTVKNSGSCNNQGTSCFLLHQAGDTLNCIYKTLGQKEECSGGGGGTATKMLLRTDGSLIRKKNGKCAGLEPVCEVWATSTDYIDQAGNRDGVNANYVDWYCADTPKVLRHKETSQKGRHEDKEKNGEVKKSKNAFYAVMINKTFMERIRDNKNVTLFSHSEVQLLDYAPDAETFDKLYKLYEEAGLGRASINARTYFQDICDFCILLGDPYIVAGDTANELSMQTARNDFGELISYEDMFLKESEGYDERFAKLYKRLLYIRQSNLCAEVVQVTAAQAANGKIPEYHSVCNLASANIMKSCVTKPERKTIECKGFKLIKPYMETEILHAYRNYVDFCHSSKTLAESTSIINKAMEQIEPMILSIFDKLEKIDYKIRLENIPQIQLLQLSKKLNCPIVNPIQVNTDEINQGNFINLDSLSMDNTEIKWHSNFMIIDKFIRDNFVIHHDEHGNKTKSEGIYYIKNHMNGEYKQFGCALMEYLATFDQIISSYMLKKIHTLFLEHQNNVIDKKNDVFVESSEENLILDNMIDYSVIFAMGWFGLILSDSFVSLNKNLPKFLQKYNPEYRSCIVGPFATADARVMCNIAYEDLEKSLEFERNVQESLQFGTIIASSFLAVVIKRKPYIRFSEGCLSKGFFHHELYTREYGRFAKNDGNVDKKLFENTILEMACGIKNNNNNSNNNNDNNYGNDSNTGKIIAEKTERAGLGNLPSKKDDKDKSTKPYRKNNTNYFIYKAPIMSKAYEPICKLRLNPVIKSKSIQKMNTDTNTNTNSRSLDGLFSVNYVPGKEDAEKELKKLFSKIVVADRPNYFSGKFKGLLKNYKNVLFKRNSYEPNYVPVTDEIDLSIESGMWSWSKSRGLIMAYGLNNSTGTGAMPTANSSIKVGGTASFQAMRGIYIVKTGNHGEVVECCWTAIDYLKKRNLWTEQVKKYISTHKGSIEGCEFIPLSVRNVLKTAFEIDPYVTMYHDVVRMAFNCQSMSSNRYIKEDYASPEEYSKFLYYSYKMGLVTLVYYTHVQSDTNGSIASTIGNTKQVVTVSNVKKPDTKMEEYDKNNSTTFKNGFNISTPKRFGGNGVNSRKKDNYKGTKSVSLSDIEKINRKSIDENLHSHKLDISDIIEKVPVSSVYHSEVKCVDNKCCST